MTTKNNLAVQTKTPELKNVALVVQENMQLDSIIDNISGRVYGMIDNRKLDLPADYSASNALISAHMILRDLTVSRKEGGNWVNIPIEQVCTKASIATALLKMTVLGLNPSKKQVDFIVYGNKLEAQPSYFGELALLKRHAGLLHESTNIVYEDDDFSFGYEDGMLVIRKHDTCLKNWKSDKISAAYTILTFKDGHRPIILQTFEKIEAGWKNSSKTYLTKNGEINPKSTHAKYKVEMVKRSMIRYAGKLYLNASNDFHVMRTRATKAGLEYNIQETQNRSEVIDLENKPALVHPSEHNKNSDLKEKNGDLVHPPKKQPEPEQQPKDLFPEKPQHKPEPKETKAKSKFDCFNE